jgi:hypothetical protein
VIYHAAENQLISGVRVFFKENSGGHRALMAA